MMARFFSCRAVNFFARCLSAFLRCKTPDWVTKREKRRSSDPVDSFGFLFTSTMSFPPFLCLEGASYAFAALPASLAQSRSDWLVPASSLLEVQFLIPSATDSRIARLAREDLPS